MTVLDAYRINRTYGLDFIDKGIKEGKLPRSFIQQWGTIKSVLHRLAAIGPKVPGVESSMNRRQTVSFAAMALLTITAPMLLLTWVFQLDVLQPIALPLAVVAMAVVLISWLTSAWYNRKVAWAIHNYLEEHPEVGAKERLHLHKWVQVLIYHTARLLRIGNVDPEKKLVKFFNDDYKGIIVMKEPQGMRKNYVVKIRV